MFRWYKRWQANKIEDETVREKTLANIDNQPWVKVIDVQFVDPKNPKTGFFELDWNKAFINSLTEAGYSGRTDEDIIDMWFTDLCRGITNEEPE